MQPVLPYRAWLIMSASIESPRPAPADRFFNPGRPVGLSMSAVEGPSPNGVMHWKNTPAENLSGASGCRARPRMPRRRACRTGKDRARSSCSAGGLLRTLLGTDALWNATTANTRPGQARPPSLLCHTDRR